MGGASLSGLEYVSRYIFIFLLYPSRDSQSFSVILPVTIFVHCYGVEHHPNQKEYDTGANQQESKHPLRESFRLENWAAIVSSVLVPMLGGSGYYLTFVWMVR